MQIFKLLVILLLISGVWYFFAYNKTETPQKATSETMDVKDKEEIVTNLNIPWEIAFLPSGDMLVTERAGKLLKIGKDTKVIAEIAGVKHIGEGGLLGLALDPEFKANKFIYLYSTADESGIITNRVERYKLDNDLLSDRVVILSGIKGSSNHDGGRIAFGPDGYLYVTTGDAEMPNQAQDTTLLNGKILRIKNDGGVPVDNSFGNAVYSYGHRNPQGLAWDDEGNLWATEHGPSGNDEINKIIKGGNYGWPVIKGQETKDGMITPIIESGKSDTWAPAGLIYKEGYLYFVGLRSKAVYKAKLESDNKLTLTTLFKNEFGRLRAIAVGPDGDLYLATSNKDGRGLSKAGDDKIIKIRI